MKNWSFAGFKNFGKCRLLRKWLRQAQITSRCESYFSTISTPSITWWSLGWRLCSWVWNLLKSLIHSPNRSFEISFLLFLLHFYQQWNEGLFLNFCDLFWIILIMKSLFITHNGVFFLTRIALWFGQPELYPPQKERSARTMRDALYPFEVIFHDACIFASLSFNFYIN